MTVGASVVTIYSHAKHEREKMSYIMMIWTHTYANKIPPNADTQVTRGHNYPVRVLCSVMQYKFIWVGTTQFNITRRINNCCYANPHATRVTLARDTNAVEHIIVLLRNGVTDELGHLYNYVHGWKLHTVTTNDDIDTVTFANNFLPHNGLLGTATISWTICELILVETNQSRLLDELAREGHVNQPYSYLDYRVGQMRRVA